MLMYVVVGLFAGVASGLIGIGGGIIIVPCLIFLFGFSQHMAQGTTLAMLVPPIGIIAAWMYFKGGYVDLPVAVLLCVGFVLGGYLGAKFAIGASEIVLRRLFGASMLILAIYMIIKG